MLNKSSDRDEKKPSGHISSGQSIPKDDPSINKLLSSLRAEMLPAVDEQPAKKSVFRQENLRIAVGLLLGLFILTLIWYVLIGPGRSGLEKNLASLANRAVTPSPTTTLTSLPPTSTPIPPSNTPSSTPTIKPTNTPVIGLNLLATAATQEITPSPSSSASSSCRQALSITLDDVGQTMCVQGTVLETVTNPTDFMMIFSYEKNAFYWVSYDLVLDNVESDTCYQIQGIIDRIGNSPVLVFAYKNLPEECP
jgi:hypothetical protein